MLLLLRDKIPSGQLQIAASNRPRVCVWVSVLNNTAAAVALGEYE